ncbi:MAG: hypothetical protein ACWA5L_05610 [bacterium]
MRKSLSRDLHHAATSYRHPAIGPLLEMGGFMRKSLSAIYIMPPRPIATRR